ncbi:UNVERIFIED_CONTAM: hypothetical protein GTU68_043708 [Idotea baltica]|nr:hypothetical protein [Idotea baltica]
MKPLINELKGTGVALVTPFNNNKGIDFDSLSKLIEYHIANGTSYLVILGTTGETATLSDAERYAVLDFVIEQSSGRIPLVAGYGGNDTMHVLKAFKDYNPNKFAAILSVAPYYNKPNQNGLYAHYATLAKNCDTPIILYNVPGRTACNIAAETTVKLAEDFDHIIGIKEASGDLEQCMEIIKNRPENFLVISGDDILTLPLLSSGVDGVISVIANAYPKATSEIVNNGLAGDFKNARTAHYHLLKMMQLIFEEGNPVGIKACMTAQGLLGNNIRLPLVNTSDELMNKITLEVKRLLKNGITS